MTTRWRWAIGGLVAVLVVVGFVRWLAITSSLEFVWTTPATEVRPGDVVEIDNPGGECVPSERGGDWYRSAAFGRWRLTHVGGERDEVAWWELGPPDRSSTLACNVPDESTFTVQIPDDVDWSPVVVCTPADEVCVEIEVDLSDE